MAPAASSPAACLGFIPVDVAGASLHRAARTMVPARLGSYGKPSGRLGLVVVAATAPGPEGGDDDRLPYDKDLVASFGSAVAAKFSKEMRDFQVSYHPLTLVRIKFSPEITMDAAHGAAMDCAPLLDFLLSKETVHPDMHKGLVLAGKAFLTMEQQAEQGYLRADALINGIEGMKLIGKAFFESEVLPDSKTPELPSSDDFSAEIIFFRELVKLFVQHRFAVHTEARRKYSYGARRAYDDSPSADRKEVASELRWEMEAYRLSYYSLVLLPSAQEMTFEVAYGTAIDCTPMLEFLLSKETVHPDAHLNLIVAAKAFLTMEEQAEQGFLRVGAIVNGILALKLIGKAFFELSPAYFLPELPSDENGISEESFFEQLVKKFVMYRSAVYAEARSKCSYGVAGANDDLPSADCERALSYFRAEMDAFKASHRPEAVVAPLRLLDTVYHGVSTFFPLVEIILRRSTAHQDAHASKELIAAGKSLLVIKHQTARNYLILDDVREAVQGVTSIAKEFLDVDLTKFNLAAPSDANTAN